MMPFSAFTASFLLMVAALTAPIVGSPAPSFLGTSTAGDRISLDDFKGKIVVLEWTNHQCPFVQKHYESGNMQATQKKARARDDVVWLTIVSSAPGEQGHVGPAEADRLTSDRKAAPNAVILDENGQIGRMYGAKMTPHMYVIDAAGALRYAGAIDSVPTANPVDISRADNYVVAALSALRADQPIVTRQSRPYGCSVKYAN